MALAGKANDLIPQLLPTTYLHPKGGFQVKQLPFTNHHSPVRDCLAVYL